MKVWYGYGSEHSSNVVMIGEFKTIEDAERAYALINAVTERASSDVAEDVVHHWAENERFSDETRARLEELGLNRFSPADIADFALSSVSVTKSGKSLRFWTDDIDIGGFVKLLVSEGAKVHVYSAHNYPDENAER